MTRTVPSDQTTLAGLRTRTNRTLSRYSPPRRRVEWSSSFGLADRSVWPVVNTTGSFGHRAVPRPRERVPLRRSVNVASLSAHRSTYSEWKTAREAISLHHRFRQQGKEERAFSPVDTPTS